MTAAAAVATALLTDEPLEDRRVRRAHALVVAPVGSRFVVKNILTSQAISCGTEVLDLLAAFADWQTSGAVARRFPHIPTENMNRAAKRLVKNGALVVEGSPGDAVDARYERYWEWGITAGLLHFGMKNCPWSSPEEIACAMSERSPIDPGPALYETHDPADLVVILPGPDLEGSPFDVMRARRSMRVFGSEPLRLRALSQVIFAGFGIVSIEDAGAYGMLPMSMTPSGGARNPYEAYVLARNVEGLEAGLHHYSAAQHTLKDCRRLGIPTLSRFLADREWVDHAAAIVLLVANFRRTMWKYKHPTAYRVVTLEAGHIAQNMLLAATAENVAAVPLAALNDSVAEDVLGLDPITQAVIHAVVLGEPPGAGE